MARHGLPENIKAALVSALSGKGHKLPAGGDLVWRWFMDLSRTRTSNGYGPNPIGFAEIEAYARLYRWPLEPRHVDMIQALDRVWMQVARAGESGSAGGVKPTGQEATPEAFDAVFG